MYIDCYVAVAGVPEARSDHAVAMARFAQDCLSRFTYLVHKLESTLGPGKTFVYNQKTNSIIRQRGITKFITLLTTQELLIWE
jgi:hypothetical protein